MFALQDAIQDRVAVQEEEVGRVAADLGQVVLELGQVIQHSIYHENEFLALKAALDLEKLRTHQLSRDIDRNRQELQLLKDFVLQSLNTSLGALVCLFSDVFFLALRVCVNCYNCIGSLYGAVLCSLTCRIP